MPVNNTNLPYMDKFYKNVNTTRHARLHATLNFNVGLLKLLVLLNYML